MSNFYKINRSFENVNDSYLNESMSQSIINDIKLKAMNIFKWNNLPETIEPYIIESILFEKGMIGFLYDATRGYLVMNINPYSNMDINFKPTNAIFTGQAYNTNRQVYYGSESDKTLLKSGVVYNPENSCVIIKNNDLYVSTYDILEPYLYTYYACKRKLITNIEQIGINNIIMGDLEDKINLNTMVNNNRNNRLINFLNVKKMKEKPSNLGLNIDFKGVELETLSKSIYGEMISKLGLNSVDYEKKERLITDEVNANNENIDNSLSLMLKARQDACKRINDLFGLDISVEINKEKVESTEEIEDITTKEVSDNDIQWIFKNESYFL